MTTEKVIEQNPAKTTLNAFFHHVSCYIALTAEWTFDGNAREWCQDKPELLGRAQWAILRNTPNEVIITNKEVLDASEGVYSDGICSLLKLIYDNSTGPNAPEHDVFLTSMHSGSSDYLTGIKVREYIDSIGGVENVHGQNTNPGEVKGND